MSEEFDITGKIVIRADPEMADMLPEYLEARREDARLLQGALNRADFALIERLGHRMKSSGATYGLGTITECGKMLENAGQKHNHEAARRAVTSLSDYLDRIVIK